MANGPSTFSFDVAQQVQMPGPVSPSPAMVGVAGQGGPARVAPAPGLDLTFDQSGKTIEALVSMGQQIIAPHVAAEKQRMAMEGMVAAMQGMSAAEISDDQIFGGMFGDTITVAAARQVERMDAVNKFNVSLSERIPELRQMDSMQFRKWLPEQMKQFLTGDDQTDALITQAFMERMPQTVDMHTKAHIGYRQEVAENAWSNDLNTAGAGLAMDLRHAAEGHLGPDRVIAAKQAFIGRLAGPGGITSAAYPKWLNKAYKRFAQEGNLHALRLMEESGVLQATQDDAQFESLMKLKDRAEVRVMSNNPDLAAGAMNRGLVDELVDQGMSKFGEPEEYLQWMLAENERSRLESGTQQLPYDNELIQRRMSAYLAGIERARIRNARAADDDPTVPINTFITAWLTDSTHLLKGVKGYTEQTKRMAVREIWSQFQQGRFSPEDFARHTARMDENFPEVESELGPIKSMLDTGAFEAGALPKSMAFASLLAKAGGANGEKVLGRYLGETRAGVLLDMLAAGADPADPEGLLEFVRQNKPHQAARVPQVDLKQVRQQVEDMGSEGFLNFFRGELGDVQLRDTGVSILSDILLRGTGLAMRGTGRDIGSALNVAWGAKSRMVDFVDGIPTASANIDVPGRRTLGEAVQTLLSQRVPGAKNINPTGASYQEAIRAVVKSKFAGVQDAYGFFGAAPEPQWAQWSGSRMEMEYVLADGSTRHMVSISPEEVLQAYQDLRAAKDSAVVQPYLLQRDR